MKKTHIGIALIIIFTAFSVSACASPVKILHTVISDIHDISEEAASVKPEETDIPAITPSPVPTPAPTADPAPTPEATPSPEIDSISDVGQKAAYLRFSPISALSNDELRTDFVKIAE